LATENHTLQGRVALVTGAARGLGLHFADALIQAGARVAMVARSADVLREAAKGFGDAALAIPTDIASPEAVRLAFQAAAQAFGGVDILVNNATLNFPHLIEEATDEELQSAVSVNVLGAIYCMREAVPLMRARGVGDIVNVSSESVTRPYPYLSVYAATKAAIENLTIGMREETRQENIRVTTLRSGVVSSGGAFMQGADPARLLRFREAAELRGHLRDSGERISPEITAKALIDLLTLPRESHVDFVSVRGR